MAMVHIKMAFFIDLTKITCVYVQKNEASITYQTVFEKMKDEELQMQQADEAKRRQEAELKLHTVLYRSRLVILNVIFHCALIICIHTVCKFSSSSPQDAFVEFLNGSHLFESMFKDDPEAETLHSVPDVAHLRETYPLFSGLSNPCRCIDNHL